MEEEIDFSLIKHEPARELLKLMLKKEPSQRATLKDILENPWVTNNSSEQVKPEECDEFHKSLGNVNRLVKMRKMGQGNTFHDKRHPLVLSSQKAS